MPIPVQVPIIEHVPNGVTTVFAYPFAILDAEDLKAQLDGAPFTAFTVSGVGSRTGGSITCTSAPTGSSLILYREISLARATDYQELGDLLAETLDDDFDRVWMAVQDLGAITDRSLRAPVGETLPTLPAASSRAERVLGFDSNGDPIMVTRTEDGGAALGLDLASSAGASLIGFLQSGAGAVPGTVESELRRDVWAAQYATVDQAVAQSPLAVTHLGAGTTTTTGSQLSGTSVVGIGPGATLKAGGTSTVLNLGYVNSPSQWTSKCLSMLTVDGNAKASDGVTFADSASTQVSGRWVIEKSTFLDCKKAIHKPTGNIGNTLRDVSIKGCDYGYYAVASASPLMHAGCDTLDRVHIAATALAAVYIDSSVSGTGGTKLVDTIIEANPGFGVFVKNWATGYTPLTLDNVWFESNATSGTVTINGTPYTPVDLYLENASHVVLVNGIVPKTKLVNSHLVVSDSFLSGDVATWSIDSESTVSADRLRIDGGVHPVTINSIAAAFRPLGNFAPVFYAPARVASSANGSNVLYSQSFDNADTYSFSGTTTVTATRVADGVIFDSCANCVFPVSTTEQSDAWTLTLNKWYVFTMDVKHVSGTLSDMSMSISSGVSMTPSFSSLLSNGKWVTVATIGKCTSGGTARLRIVNGAAGSQTIRFSALQVIECDTEAEALAYYNGGEYRSGSSRPRVTYSTVAPTTGTWAVGDRCFNKSPAVGQPKSWACTVAGTPGTWVSEGNL